MECSYVGDYRLHDSTILGLEQEERGNLLVHLRSIDGELLQLRFNDVQSVTAHRAVGMMMYSVREVAAPAPFRLFQFVNWRDEDDANLEVVAVDCVFEV